MRHLADEPLAAGSPTVATGHICGCRSFIDEYEPSWIEPGLHLEPCSPRCGYVRSVLFGCVQTFFKAEAQMTKEAEDRGLADRRHSHLEFGQRDVRLCVHPSRNPRPVPLQRIAFVTTKLLRLDTPAATPTREKATDRTDTHPAQFRSLFIRVARLDCLNYATPQVLRIWLAHSCWPPCPVGSLNHNQRFMGMPDSTFPQNALERQLSTGVGSVIMPVRRPSAHST